MAANQTLTIIKPHALRDNNAGAILAVLNEAGFRIAGMKVTRLTRDQTENFYNEHRGKYFYPPLVDMMSEGPIIVAILEKDNAVTDLRRIVGSTDPAKADPGTIRRMFGLSMRENAIHASDGDQNALREIGFFFSETERY